MRWLSPLEDGVFERFLLPIVKYMITVEIKSHETNHLLVNSLHSIILSLLSKTALIFRRSFSIEMGFETKSNSFL